MHRFYLPPEQCQTRELVLAGPDAHHAAHVLRLKKADRVTVLDGAGHSLLCEIIAVERKAVPLRVVGKEFAPPLPCPITLVQAIPRGKIIESIIQKATELGVSRIVPLLSERVAVHLDKKQAAGKAEKWRETAIEAIKQCGSAWLPKIEPPITPGDFLARRETFDLTLIGSLQNDSRHPRQYFQQFTETAQRPPRSVCLWIGPEGDFSPAEIETAKQAGALPITLGPLVLRVETAAIASLAIVNYELHG